jgi:hypothetical protein
LFGLFGDDAGGQFLYSSLADAVPQDLQFIDNTFFRIVANVNNRFEVEFLKGNPAFYSIASNTANLSHLIYAAPGETIIDPSKMLDILSKTKYLEGQNISDYKISQFGYYKRDDYSYQEYFDHLYNQSSAGEKIKLSRSYLLPL